MSATTLLRRCRAEGLDLALEPPDTIVVRGPADIRARYLPEIRQAKPALLRLLTDHQEAVQEAVEERVAIMEFDGGLPRVKAQEVAELAGQFYAHHCTCPACRHGTHAASKLHRPCPDGARLWSDYVLAAAGREAGHDPHHHEVSP